MLNIPNGLKELGFEGSATYVENMTIKSLAEASAKGQKTIVSVWHGGTDYHAIVVDGISNGRAYIRDPWPVNKGAGYSISLEELRVSMTGRAVIVQPKPKP